ncbi:hypothetical protein GZZ44_16400 [Klebsiella aerogenes]|uniref:hypothetical protein n=1 Tax=Klebsiella aerogenes TaxID=548 RepID=UPI0011DCA572|nr:hypothetical protein [Klebsiella aerogenes]EKZ9923358.1 hypothetical protein [Klebsiella aerogenes]MBK0634532.1 hypothetical protein [Klebsiella aerogenes]MBY5236147.1 hypothetical protein [Klebsiella aerogenes]TXU78743.1 hypothetical protein D4N00_15080 [Klebsiella aerogenes]UWA56655.1 hypothetical protein M5T48_06055 [Klebsiella aerogenes]
MRRIYIRLAITLVIAALVYGFLVPSLISMRDTVAVISGFALALTAPPCLFAIFKGIFVTKEKK